MMNLFIVMGKIIGANNIRKIIHLILKKNIAFGYIKFGDKFKKKNAIEIEVEKIKYKAIIESEPLHDPKNTIIKI